MARRNRKTWVKQHAKFLSRNLDVGSSIRYRAYVQKYLGNTYDYVAEKKRKGSILRTSSMEMTLTDCTRSINWSGNIKEMKGKLTAAVKVMNRALSDIKQLQKRYDSIKVGKHA